jgi:hypothetical protein
MYKLLISAAVGLTLAVSVQAQTAQATCNQKAGDKKGEAREAFMKTCMDQQAQRSTRQNSRPLLESSPAYKSLPNDRRRELAPSPVPVNP